MGSGREVISWEVDSDVMHTYLAMFRASPRGVGFARNIHQISRGINRVVCDKSHAWIAFLVEPVERGCFDGPEGNENQCFQEARGLCVLD